VVLLAALAEVRLLMAITHKLVEQAILHLHRHLKVIMVVKRTAIVQAQVVAVQVLLVVTVLVQQLAVLAVLVQHQALQVLL
jgi:hypothetical protein